MKPIDFSESTNNLQKPASMTDKQCGPLSVYSDGRICVSKWKMNLKERLHCLIYGFVWLSVHSGETQPPVSLEAKNGMFKYSLLSMED